MVLTNVIGCDSCLLRSHPIFRSHCPTDRIRFFLYLSHNAFREMIEINNRMRSIRSSLTCQSPSDSIRFFKIASDCALSLPDFPSDFPSDPSNHQIIWQWDAGFRILWEATMMRGTPLVHHHTHLSPNLCLEAVVVWFGKCGHSFNVYAWLLL